MSDRETGKAEVAPAEVAGLTPLEWSKEWGPDEDGDESHASSTSFGIYRVERIEGRWKWSYCFDEYYDEDENPCEGLDDGKALAQSHWNDRVSSIIAPAESALASERAAHARTREALEPFARWAEEHDVPNFDDDPGYDDDDHPNIFQKVTVGHFRAARRAYQGGSDNG